ncbi:stage II sporulation protein M [Lentzea californiensis]|uniref:stage II sporulation protein M n=1 Tax=Lentzea californiensis TaxID=438851 RepID=UPI002165F387|nr:stage II sporulation protein M [Lentzea californiensis]MCR3751133.1 putative membrane protein SpoIIM, required for sporulation [Lentzea californiensis]
MDLDVFIDRHRESWRRLERLVKRSGKLSGPEADELIELYQRVTTHLSVVRSQMPDPATVERLSALVAQARSVLTGTHTPAWRTFTRFFTHRLPAAIYLGWRWWVPAGIAFYLVTGIIAAWIASNPDVQATIAAPEEIREMTRVGGGYESYYSSDPAGSFAAKVWTNNAWVAAACLLLGVLFAIPPVYLLFTNALNVGVGIGLMFGAGRGGVFLGLLAPHGLLELTAVFVAAGIGMRLGWQVIDPGKRTRGQALATEGRSVVAVALGLVVVLLVSGVLEGFVTPSGLPTWARIGIGVVAEVLFLLYVFVIGRRAARQGETGDMDASEREDVAPVAV